MTTHTFITRVLLGQARVVGGLGEEDYHTSSGIISEYPVVPYSCFSNLIKS